MKRREFLKAAAAISAAAALPAASLVSPAAGSPTFYCYEIVGQAMVNPAAAAAFADFVSVKSREESVVDKIFGGRNEKA